MRDRLIAGAMSGTSADGVDVAIVRIAGRGFAMTAELVEQYYTPYGSQLRNKILSIRQNGAVSLAELGNLGQQISICYAEAVITAKVGLPQLDAIAAHGQTLYHAPPVTIQWFDPALLAARTNLAVVSDFRRADCAAGGQGAPLVPLADYVLFRHSTQTRVLLNIGGIANLTFLPAGADAQQLIAFDTGPGNCISDWLVRTEGAYDAGGERAARGQMIQSLLDRAMDDAWFGQKPPKSTDGPAMIELFQRAAGGQNLGNDDSTNDLLRTAVELSARSIAIAVRQFCPAMPQELIASGGGVHNGTLMDRLRDELAEVRILTSDELGVPSSAKEAMAFALLGAATLDGEPGNIISCTGAELPVVLGSITPRPRK
jgi:anhydro-N-acetylmuramic acid kinase